MKHKKLTYLAAALATACLPLLQANAHHSITGEFDQETTIQLKGVLTDFDWANPHLWYYVDVTNASGEIEHWQCTTGTNPNRLLRGGWKKSDLVIGSVVVFDNANPARDNSHTCYTPNIALEDGTRVFSGRRGE
jgi:hypothetical protein